MKEFFADHFDKLLVLVILTAFLVLLPYSAGDTAKFVEQSASLALGALIGLVRNQGKKEG